MEGGGHVGKRGRVKGEYLGEECKESTERKRPGTQFSTIKSQMPIRHSRAGVE